jgi:hypothetical protein
MSVVASTNEGGSQGPLLLAGLSGVTLLTIGALAAILFRRRASMNAPVVLTPPNPARAQLANPMEVMSGDPLLLALDERRGIAPIRTIEHDPFSRPRWVERLEAESGEAPRPPMPQLLPAEPTTLEHRAEDQPIGTLGG